MSRLETYDEFMAGAAVADAPLMTLEEFDALPPKFADQQALNGPMGPQQTWEPDGPPLSARNQMDAAALLAPGFPMVAAGMRLAGQMQPNEMPPVDYAP